MKIYVEELRFQSIIGILDFERTIPQDVEVNLTIEYHYTDNNFINYADVALLIKETMQNEKFLLLEDAIEKISKKLKIKFSQINSLFLKITKPSILPDCKVSLSEIYKFDS